MARVHLVHWDPEDARALVAAITALGHEAVYLPGVTGTPLMRALRASAPDAFLIDLTRRPSHGREVAMALRSSPATRHIPLVFGGGDEDSVARMRALLPDASFTPWRRLKAALSRALRPVPRARAPVLPTDTLYAARTLTQKLGIAAGEQVAVVGAPPAFAALLLPLPKGARLRAEASASAQRFVWFVRTPREVQMALGRLTALLTTQTAWLAWPKKTSGVRTGVDGNLVRESGLAAGLVDFKVCSIDATWSGLAFTQRRRQT